MSDLIVRVEQGELRGVVNKSANGKVYYSFMGIPFAEPPVGALRFKSPVPKAFWSGIRDANKEGGTCAQVNVFSGLHEYSGTDDCLYLNVHTPQLKNNDKPLPVMVNIHGGGFQNWSGSSDVLGPEYIIEEDTIFVSFNYRLGVLGFLCTDPINARGDMGLLDQQLALKWTKNNIASFNGDSNNITIFGISAGSASVEYHLLSEKSHDYFNKAILQSGSTLNPWARTITPINHAVRLAQAFGYKSNTNDGLFEYINKIDSKDLVKTSLSLLNNDDLKEGNLFPFSPVVNHFKDNIGFLTEEPEEILKKGKFNKIPIISGLCEIEGMMIKLFYSDEGIQKIMNNKKFFEYIPNFLDKNIENCEEKLKYIYKKNIDDKNEDDDVMAFLSDISFNGGVFSSLKHRLKHNSCNEYFYCFAYDGNINMLKYLMKTNDKGTCHGDDHSYLGPNMFVPRDIATITDIKVKNRMVKMWTDFSKYGNPTPFTSELIPEKWLPTSKEKFNYLKITDELKMSDELWRERTKFWMELYKNI